MKNDVENDVSTIDSTGDYSVVKNKKADFIAKILCVVVALVIWFYVMGVDSPTYEKKFISVPVNIENTTLLESEMGLSVITGSGYVVDITIKGKKSEINRLKVEDIKPYVDISNIKVAGKYPLDIKVSLSNSLIVSDKSPNNITVNIDRKTSVSIPIEVNRTEFALETNYEFGDPILSQNEVIVTGAETELKKIDKAQVNLALGKVTKSMTASGKIILLNKDGEIILNPYIKMLSTEVIVTLPVYTYKELPLVVEYKNGYFNENNVNIKITPTTIKVKGPPELINTMDSIILTSIDEKKTEDGTLTQQIMLPEDIKNVDEIDYATIEVAHKGTEIREIVVDKIKVNNPNNIKYELLEDSLNVKIRGSIILLSNISSNNIEASIDLGYINNSSGTMSVPVTIQIKGILSKSVYEMGEYKIPVKVY